MDLQGCGKMLDGGRVACRRAKLPPPAASMSSALRTTPTICDPTFFTASDIQYAGKCEYCG